MFDYIETPSGALVHPLATRANRVSFYLATELTEAQTDFVSALFLGELLDNLPPQDDAKFFLDSYEAMKGSRINPFDLRAKRVFIEYLMKEFDSDMNRYERTVLACNN